MTEIVLAFVINATWQATLIAAIGLLLAHLLRRGPARLRFQLLALTLASCVVAPVMPLFPRHAIVHTATVSAPPVQARGANVFGVAYLCGLAFVASRFVLAALRAWRIAASSIPFCEQARVSSLIESPITIGRTVFLPPFVIEDRRLLAAALAHEGAHLRRNDYALHFALECIALPLYFHPVAFMLRRAIAEAREIACDEEAAVRCGAKEYASALLQIASVAAASRMAMAVSMAATSIERRITVLLRPKSTRKHGWSTKTLVFVPLLIAIACTRVSVAPTIAHATLCGHWELIAEASDLRATQPSGYEKFTQTIEQGPTRVAVRQLRVANGRARQVAWSVITDGVRRPVTGITSAQGSATWRSGTLEVNLTGPGAHRENATAFVRGERLICDGETEQGRFHAEFQRVDP
jgi:hypothetical protein